MKTVSILLLLLATAFAATGQVLFKVGAHGNTSYLDYFTPAIFFGGILYAAGTVIWIYVLSYEDLVDVYAYSALTFVFVYFSGVVFLKEKVEMMAIFGVVMVIGGLYLIAANSSS